MLDEGAGGKDALALADAVDFLGAKISAAASWDASTVRLRVPVARLDDALALLADVALRPDFPEAELERLRKERAHRRCCRPATSRARSRTGRSRRRCSAPATATASRSQATPRSSTSFTVAELRAFHAARYAPGGAALVVVGDVTASVLPALEKAFGAWKASGPATPLPVVPAPRQLASRSVVARRQEGGGAVAAARRARRAGLARSGYAPTR